MADQSDSRGSMHPERERESAGSSTRMKGGQSQRGRGGPSSGRPDQVRDQSRGSGTLGARQHTNAGSTGTSGGQISPQPGMTERSGASTSGRNQ